MATIEEASKYLSSLSQEQRDSLFTEWRSRGQDNKGGAYINWVANEGMAKLPTSLHGAAKQNAPTIAPKILSSIGKNLSSVVPSSSQTKTGEGDTGESPKVQIDSESTKEKPIHVVLDDANSPGKPLDLAGDIFKDLGKRTQGISRSVGRRSVTDENNPMNSLIGRMGNNLFGPPISSPATPPAGKDNWGGLIYGINELVTVEKEILKEVAKEKKSILNVDEVKKLFGTPNIGNKGDTSKPLDKPFFDIIHPNDTGARLGERAREEPVKIGDKTIAPRTTPSVGRDEAIENKESLGQRIGSILGGLMNPNRRSIDGETGGAIEAGQKRGGKLGALQSAAGHVVSAATNTNENSAFGDTLNAVGSIAGMIPGVGGAIQGVLSFGAAIFKSLPSLKEWTEKLHNSNMQFAEFSASMARVSAQQEIADIEYQRRRGRERSESAQRLMESKNRLREAQGNSLFGDRWANMMNDAAAALNEKEAKMIELTNELLHLTKKIADKDDKDQEGGLLQEANEASDFYWKNHQRPPRMMDKWGREQ